jgi:hypothetical protein
MITSRLLWGLAVVCLCCAAGCRVERDVAASPFAMGIGAIDGEDDDEPSEEASVAGMNAAGGGGTSAGGASETGGAGDGSSTSGGEGGAAGEPSAGAGGTGGGAGEPVEPDASVVGGSCDPEVLACNPVTNEGCPPPMQCAVDLVSDVLAGYCVFNGPVADGCFNSGVTESCPPKETCFDFACRTLCFCDDDCKEGQCCVDPVGDLGFKVCGSC